MSDLLTQNNLLIGGLVLLAIALVSILMRKRKSAGSGGASAAQPESAEPVAIPEAMPTAFSAMGIMANADGPLRGEYFIIQQAGLTIGRDPASCDVVCEGSTVSRQHARLEYTDAGLVVRSLSDVNQTFLNDEPVKEAPIRAGDRIRVEDVIFKVLPHGASG